MSVPLCRTLYLSSLAFDTNSQISLELATPLSGSSDDGLAICFMGSNHQLDSSTVTATASTGGNQFTIQEQLTPLNIERLEFTSFWSIVKNDTFYQDPELLRTFTDLETVHTIPWRDILNSPAAHSNSSTLDTQRCGQESGSDWAHCRSECVLLWGGWKRKTRVEVSLSVRHPPAEENPPDLPVLWTAPFTLQGNDSLVITGPSKLGAACDGPVLLSSISPAFVNACNVAASQGIDAPADSPSGDQCVDALKSHRDELAAGAGSGVNGTATAASVQLPDELQWPPIVQPWPPEDSAGVTCGSGYIRSKRNSQECVSCLWGTEAAAQTGERLCECGSSSYSLPVGNRACSDPLYVGSTEVPVKKLPEQLCEFFKQEYNSMLQGELPSEIVAHEYISTFAHLSSTIVDVHRLHELRKQYYSSMMIDARHPHVPTREHGVWNMCSRCFEDGTFVDERTKKRVPSVDYRYQAAHVFRWIGFVLSEVGSTCEELWDPKQPSRAIYGPYEPRQCAPLPDPTPSLLK